MLLRVGHLPIEYAEVHTVRLFSQTPRHFHIIEQKNVSSSRHVFDCFDIWCIVIELVERFLDIVMLILVALRGVVCNVACNIWRGFEAPSTVHFHQPHFAIKIKAEHLT